MKELQIIERYINRMSKKHNVPFDEIYLYRSNEGYIEVWQFIQAHPNSDSKWIQLESNKIET